jgi:hypothetical protein
MKPAFHERTIRMKNLTIAVAITVVAALLGSPRLCAADADEPSALRHRAQW